MINLPPICVNGKKVKNNMSLYTKLFNHCINVNYTSLETVYKLAEHHKQSHAERQMRLVIEETASKPYWGVKQVIPEKNHKGHIIGYKTIIKGQTENKQGKIERVTFKQKPLF